MSIFGITGGLCSGKSLATKFFKEKPRVQTCSADQVVSELYRKPEVMKNLESLFGSEIFSEGQVNTNVLAQIVFQDTQQLRALERLIHPCVREELKTVIREKQEESEALFLEIPLLYEAGFEDLVDKVIVMQATASQQKQRALEKGLWNSLMIDAVLQRQWPLEEKTKRADFVIDNSKTLEETRRQLESLWLKIRNHA